MHPFLVVGCGGSGGVTAQFLMDQLKADLAQRGIMSLPKAWQFVHIDVPLKSDGGGGDRPESVNAQGGSYVALGPQAANYLAVSGSVAERLINAKRYEQLSTWAVPPNTVDVSIANGAGQIRAVGRMVTLGRLSQLNDGLRGALDELSRAQLAGELESISRRIGGDPEQAGSKPIVLVVSSMAGGSGASMVLDVCRVLSQFSELSPENTGLFLYTPEIFDSLPPHARSGVPGNALAMMGELIATQLGAASRDDQELFAALDMGDARESRGVPFGRVFPIGARIGENGAKFGDGNLDDIYRGVGRGLAALMLSSSATRDWASYDLGNSTGADQITESFGWSAGRKDLQWGTFGFAQLSLGRERYAEYAAQRLARAAVMGLTEGHRSPGSPETDEVQLERRVAARMPTFASMLPLPSTGEIGAWFDAYFDPAAHGAAQRIVADNIESLLTQEPVAAQQWIGHVTRNVTNGAPRQNVEAQDAAYSIAFGWYQAVYAQTEQAVADIVAADGLPTALRLLRTLQGAVDMWAGQTRHRAQTATVNIAALPETTMAKAAAVKGTIGVQHEIVNLFRAGYVDSSREAVKLSIAALLADALVSYKNELLTPLLRALGDASASLERARSSEKRGAGLAQLRTDEFAEWPVGADDQPVPARFTHAQNEVLLIDASQFPDLFKHHITRQLKMSDARDDRTDEATGSAVRQIILDKWDTNLEQREGRLLVTRSRWRPTAFAYEPGKKSERAATTPASYDVAVLTKQLVARARDWVAVPGSEFQAYSSISLRQYVDDLDVAPHERARRGEEVVARFRDTLELAQPLVAVDQTLVQAIHGREATVAYKFGAIPFGGLALAAELRSTVQRASAQDSLDFFDKVLESESKTSRIEIFGSYHPLAPLTFSSLLRPLGRGWANASMAREKFWSGRRSRRLPGAVAMAEKQRMAVIGGWYVARFTGRLRLPGEVHALDAVQVWDPDNRRDWVPFPSPLIVSDLELARSTTNYLPAVVMSYGLAMAQVSALGTMAPLLPYTVLRKYWDSFESGIADTDPHTLLAASTHVARFLSLRDYPEGSPKDRMMAASDDPEVMRKNLLATIASIRETLGKDYLRPGQEGAPGGGQYSVISREQDLWGIPLFHEIARDAYVVLGTLEKVVKDAPIQTFDQPSGGADVSLSG